MEPAAATAQPLVILNPTANRGEMAHHRAAAAHWVERTGAEYLVTKKRNDAQTMARLAADLGRPVIVVGGDGTVNEVVNGILASRQTTELGIVPAGSGNDFACNTLGLPKDPEMAFERAFTGTAQAVDVGMVNGRFFANSFSVGLDGDIAVAAEKMKRIPFMQGEVLYYSASLRQLLFGYRRCPWLTYALDDAEKAKISTHYVLIAVTNGPTYGAGFRINPTADHRDGRFDICAITHTPLLRALSLLPVVRRGKHEGQKEVTFSRAQKVYIETRQVANAQMDGETMQGTIFDVHIKPGALRVRI